MTDEQMADAIEAAVKTYADAVEILEKENAGLRERLGEVAEVEDRWQEETEKLEDKLKALIHHLTYNGPIMTPGQAVEIMAAGVVGFK